MLLLCFISFVFDHGLGGFDGGCPRSSLCRFERFDGISVLRAIIIFVVIVVTILPITFISNIFVPRCLFIRVWPLNDIFYLEFVFL